MESFKLSLQSFKTSIIGLGWQRYKMACLILRGFFKSQFFVKGRRPLIVSE